MSSRSVLVAIAILAASALSAAAPPARAVDACAGVLCLIDQPVLQAVPGDHHACFLLADGDVVCSGGNEAGQALGRRQGDAVAIAAGSHHTCALLRTGAVACFGSDEFGLYRSRAATDAVAITAGGHQTCALLRSGNVDCWGTVGGGPALDWTGGHAVAIDATTYYTCALFDDTSVDCWGIADGTFGQTYGWPSGVVALGGGDQHTCVVLEGGNVRCWGTGHWGAMDPYDGGDAVAVDGGYWSTCILTTEANVICQGRNTVEDGSCVTDLVRSDPLTCEGLESSRDTRSRMDGRVRAMTIYPGTAGACYVLDDQSAECRGVFPTAQPEPTGENTVRAPSRGVALDETTPATPAVHREVDPRVVLPVRICPVSGTCFGYVFFDPGTGPLVVDVPAATLGPPVTVSARFAGASATADATSATPVAVDAGVSAGACAGDACAALP